MTTEELTAILDHFNGKKQHDITYFLEKAAELADSAEPDANYAANVMLNKMFEKLSANARKDFLEQLGEAGLSRLLVPSAYEFKKLSKTNLSKVTAFIKKWKANDVKAKIQALPAIPYDTRPTVLLTGNGICKSFISSGTGAAAPAGHYVNTDDIIHEAWLSNAAKHHGTDIYEAQKRNSHPIWALQFPMQMAVAAEGNFGSSMAVLADTLREADVPARQQLLLEKILNTKFDAILTTNYSLEFEKTALAAPTGKFSRQRCYKNYVFTEEQTAQQAQFGIFQCTKLKDDFSKTLWHIHGTALRKNSMVIGHQYYGKLLSEVTSRAKAVCRNYKSACHRQVAYNPKSWIDYLLIGDVHIMGFGLDLCESDIWDLLSYKHSAAEVFGKSTVTFHTSSEPKPEFKLLLETYGIKLDIMPRETGDYPYVQQFEKVCEKI